MEDLLKHPKNDDYVFVRLLDQTPILSPMEKVRSVYPNAMHVERVIQPAIIQDGQTVERVARHKMDDLSLFRAFYQEVRNIPVPEEIEVIFKEILHELIHDDHEPVKQAAKEIAVTK